MSSKDSKELTFDEEKHEYRLNGRILPSVTQILREIGFVDDTYFTEDSAARGIAVHKATELYDLGTLDEDSLDPRLVDYLEGWKRFRNETGFFPTSIEGRGWSKFGYVGTFDRVGVTDNGSIVLLDIKSSMYVPDWIGLQLGGYIQIITEKGMIYKPFIPYEEIWSVHLSSGGLFKIERWDDRRNDFLAIARTYQLKQEIKQ